MSLKLWVKIWVLKFSMKEGKMIKEEIKKLTKEEISRRIREGVKAVIEQVLEE